MYVCHCFGITDKQIKKMIKKGALSIKDIADISSAGTVCKICIADIKKILDAEIKT